MPGVQRGSWSRARCVAAGLCAIFGLPVAHASLPHSVLHLQALATHGAAGDLTQSMWGMPSRWQVCMP